MSENAIKFQDEEEVSCCFDCKIKNETIESFIDHLKYLQEKFGEFTFDLLQGQLEDFYDEIHDEGKRSAYKDIMDYSHYSIHETFGGTSEDEE